MREWTPELTKVDDGRQIVTVSTSSGSSGDENKEEEIPVGKRSTSFDFVINDDNFCIISCGDFSNQSDYVI